MRTEIKCPRCGRCADNISILSETFDCVACGSKRLSNKNYVGHGEKIDVSHDAIQKAIVDAKNELSERFSNIPDETVAALTTHENKFSQRTKKIISRIVVAIIAGIIVQFVIRVIIAGI